MQKNKCGRLSVKIIINKKNIIPDPGENIKHEEKPEETMYGTSVLIEHCLKLP